MNFSVFSQRLTPKVQVQNKDTLFCFTIPQSKIIAKHLQNSTYCDSVLMQTESEAKLLDQLKLAKNGSMLLLKLKSDNQQKIITNQDAAIGNLTKELEQSEKKFRKQRWLKRFFAASAFVIAAVAVFK